LRRRIRRERYDLVHASEPISALVASLATVRTGQPLLFHRHHGSAEGFQYLFSRVSSHFADVVMACSQAAALEAVRQDHADQRRVVVAENGVPPLREVSTAEIVETREHLSIPVDAYCIVLVARIRPEKGHSDIIAAMPLIQSETDREVRLVIVGDGPSRDVLQREADSRAPGAVHFVGEQDDVAPWFALADVAVAPSHNEPFGLAAVEALAAGRPLVATSVGGLVEIIAGTGAGVLVPPKAPELLATAISSLLSDPDRRAQLGQKGRERWQSRFTAHSMVGRWVGVYETALEVAR
jgi:glycosyltransferase involved in cell wall biosynthesis